MYFDLSEKQKMLRDSVREFSERELEPRAAQIEAEALLPDDLIKKMAGIGLLGMVVPQQYGGGGTDNLACAIACEQAAYSGTGAWWLAAMNNSIPLCILRFGTEEQRRKYLPPLCDGTAYASIQFTEDDTGSDPEALKTRAARKGDYYVLNGTKRFSTFGARDGYAVTYTKDEEGQCTAFVVRKNSPGYSAKKVWEIMGAGGVEAADVYLEDVKVSEQDMLGARGKGFGILLWWVAHEKVIQCAANVGMAQAAMDEAVKYAKARVSRGRPIADMQGIRWELADMEARLQAARWLTYRSAFALDKDPSDSAVQAATAKLFVAPATAGVVESARRIHGAYGYAKEFKIERLSRAILGAASIATSLELNRSIVGGALVR